MAAQSRTADVTRNVPELGTLAERVAARLALQAALAAEHLAAPFY